MAGRAARAWLNNRAADERRGMELTELIAHRYPLIRHRREFRRRLEEIEDQVTERLLPLCEREFHGLDEGERVAALTAVADAIENADLSDETMFRLDIDPIALAREIRRQVPQATHQAALSESAAELFGLVLDQTCYYLAHLIRELPEFQPRAAVETLSRLSGIARQIGEVLERLPVASLDRITGTDDDEEFRNRYGELVSSLYDRLDILGITTNYYEPSVTLTVAYLSLTASTGGTESRVRENPMPEPHRLDSTELRSQVVRVEDALGHKQRVLIQGDAGAGKSTLLQWLAVTAVRQRFVGSLTGWNGLVPFLIRLRDFADRALPDGEEILLHANAPQWGIVPEGWVHRIADAGRALFLIDGVDELPEQDRAGVRSWLRAIILRYPGCRLVVTSRPSDLIERWFAKDRFHLATLEPMTTEDVGVFVDKWHSALLDSSGGQAMVLPCPREEVPKHQRSLLAHLAARPHLRALARNPLLCAMICALNLDRRANLPRDRMTLYDAALDMLLERRDAEKQVLAGSEIQLTAVEKRALLRALAWWLNENRRTEMSREEAIYQLQLKIGTMPGVTQPPADVLTYLLERSGLLRQPVLGRVDFVHRTFQEFLAAKEVVERDSIDLLVNNATSDLWRETVLMACAHATAPQRDRLLSGILNNAYAMYRTPEVSQRRQLMLLAAACLEIAVEVSARVIAEVERCLTELLPPTSYEEVNTLATVGSSLFRVLPADLRDMDPLSAVLTVRTVALSNEPSTLEVLRRYARDRRWEVQDEIMTCARYFDLDEYTGRVLADAPFFDHGVEIREHAWLPYLDRFRDVEQIRVLLHPDRLDDLSIFARTRKLHGLLVGVVGDCDLTPLEEQGNLEYLNLTCDGAFAGLSTLAGLPSMTELVLTPGEPIDDLDFLPALTGLTRLEIANLDPGAELTTVTTLRNLRSLGLRGCRAPVDTGALAGLPQLERLDLRDCGDGLDLSPLSGRRVRVLLNRGQAVRGLSELDADAEIQRF
ncbi:NACHT domain-containing protein [Amycolatopsis cihanbeyliensis]|uniref:NACHT domain-containing protein n=2 Tax=Amycolatopsis cihanbeyliensis TaxID=1128664 RepID=A0A542CS72_AMYCI|nr:NACHT domain-containing protein [Amycolatopsis cihanbeyliensis]